MIAFAMLGFAVVMGVLMYTDRQKQRSMLDRIGLMLGGGNDASSKAWGDALGARVTYRFATRGTGSNSTKWTEIDVPLPPYPISVNVRRHGWFDQGRIERGTMVDVKVGDPTFDEAFLVEAAPEDVVQRLLDGVVQRQLLMYRDVELTTEAQGDQKVLRLAVRGWIEEVADAQAAAELPVRIVTRLRGVYSQLEAEAPQDLSGAPFRPMLDDRAARSAAVRREQQVSAVEQLREERATRSTTLAILIFIAIFVIAAFAMSN